MALVVALVLLVVAGVPLAFAITRDLLLAAILAPLVTGLQCTAAAVGMAVVGGPAPAGAPFAPWLLAVTVASWAGAGLLLRRDRPALPPLGVVDVVVMYGPLLLPALLVRRPPVAWDARSIWWFHAAWIDQGPTVLREALANPALAFTHPDYPPFAPATVAGAWTVTPGSGLWVAQAVSTVLTLSAVALLVYAVRQLVPSVHPMAARLVAAAVGLGTWAVSSYAVAAGYVDHLWAAALAAAVVLLLIGGSIIGPDGGARADAGPDAEPDAEPGNLDRGLGRTHLLLAVVLMTVAALAKNEGFVAVGVVAVVFTVRARRQLRLAAWVWIPVGAGVAWTVVARAFGATSDLADSPRIGQLLGGDLAPLERIGPTLSKLSAQVGWVVAAAVVVSVVGSLGLGARRRSLGLVPVRWPWSVVALFTAALVATYVISPYEIVWHLVTSVDRVGVLLVLVALSIIASWVLVAVAPADGDDPDPAVGPRGRARSERDRARIDSTLG